MTYDELIAALEKATGPDRELDHEIAQFIYPGEKLQWPEMYKASSEFWCRRNVEKYTSSIDAALTLVPEYSYAEIHTDNCAFVRINGEEEYECWNVASPAIALCIAALKARGARR